MSGLRRVTMASAMCFLRKVNGGVRFCSDGDVLAWAGGKRRRRTHWLDAVNAIAEALDWEGG